MSIYITGDIHGRLDIAKLFAMNFDADGLTKDDYVIICGDFGLIWDQPGENMHAQSNEDTLDWLDNKPWTTLFIDGNHENHDRLASYPVSDWHDGKVHFIRDSVIHLMRGEMFDIDGHFFFTMGGARSIDRHCRVEGHSWWASEIPSDEEKQHAIDTLDMYGWTCDYVLTHDCPANIMYDLEMRTSNHFTVDEWEQWLQYIADRLTFSQWFFGHYHEDYKHIGIGGKFTVLYDYIYDLSSDDWAERMRMPRINSFAQIPDSKHDNGYTITEIANFAGVSIETVEEVMKKKMYGSTVVISDDGDILINRGDIFRILDWL